MICLEEKESNQFIIFSCKHKTCNECFPLLLIYSTPCPVCQQPITMYIPNQKLPSNCIEYCKLFTGIGIMSLFIFYVANFAFQKN